MLNDTMTIADNRDAQAQQLSACEAALALPKNEKNQAMRLLISLSRDGDPLVRIRAAQGLMQIGGERAVIGLMDLMDDHHSQVRIAAIEALGVLRAHEARDRIETIIKSDPEISVRITAARTLGKLGSKNGLLLIIRLLDHEDMYFRSLAVLALKDIIGQTFPTTREGIRSAKRYLEMNLNKYFTITGGS